MLTLAEKGVVNKVKALANDHYDRDAIHEMGCNAPDLVDIIERLLLRLEHYEGGTTPAVYPEAEQLPLPL